MENTENSACSIQASLDVLGDRWTILILRDAFRGVRRFDDFRKDLEIARPVLTDRLKRLVRIWVAKMNGAIKSGAFSDAIEWLDVLRGTELERHPEGDLPRRARRAA